MLHLSARAKRYTALTLLLLFVQVTAGQCWCALAAGLPGHQPAVARGLARLRYPHPGCHGHPAATGAAHKMPHGATKPTPGCCRDKSAAILKALTTPPPAKLNPVGPLLLAPAAVYLTLARSARWSPARAVCLVPPSHLPPKIPDIRIFIQSLTV